MRANEFLNEVLQTAEHPQNFAQIYEQFRFYQRKAIETLQEFHRVCEKNGIPYQLAYGSLLGAIRDHGQIPWDYDVDVMVPYEQKDALIQALKEDLNGDYYFYCPDVDPKCRHYMMRLAPKGVRTEALHVDVFYVIGAPEDAQQTESFCRELYQLFNQKYDKKVNIKEEARGRVKRLVKLLLRRLQVIGISEKEMDARMDELCRMYPLEKAERCVSVDTDCKKRTFPTKVLWETQLYKTDVGEFRITKHYDRILTDIYGDYNKIYPVKSRIDEMMSCLAMIQYYEKH